MFKQRYNQMLDFKSLKFHAIVLPLIICVIGAASAATSISVMLDAHLSEEKSFLSYMVKSQVQLIEAVADFDAQHSESSHPLGAFGATLVQVAQSLKALGGFGETGQFVVGKLIDGQGMILEAPRAIDDINFQAPKILLQPMQRALAGEVGVAITTDINGREILAAYSPVSIVDIGLVAKIDLDEIYGPFIFSAKIAVVLTFIMLLIGVYAARKFYAPILEIEQEKDRVEKYLNIAGSIIIALDIDGKVELINRRGRELLGLSGNEIMGKNWYKTAVFEDDRELAHTVYQEIANGSFDMAEYFEYRVIDRSGEPRLIAWQNSPMYDEQGFFTGTINSGMDITDYRAAEDALRISETRFNQSQEFANIGTWDWDIQTGGLYWSPRIAPLFGYQAGEIETTYENFVNAIHPDDRQAVMDAVNACVEDNTEYNIEHRVVWPDGTVRWLLEKGDVVRDAAGKPLNMLGVVQDITESKLMQAQLVQSSKMATLGEMATGVAHELNQPLNVIRMATNNIQYKLDKGTQDPAYMESKLNKIVAQVERASSIIDHMRIFGRKPDAQTAMLEPAEMINSTIGLIGEQLRLLGVDVNVDIQSPHGLIRGHRVQIEQVLLNLLSNAKDSLSETGGARHKQITMRVRTQVAERGECVCIDVEDNGQGIDEDVLPRIFEPFYTTKEIGKGTGLGLSISYGIVVEMGGVLSARNTETGACFTISLPAFEREEAA